VDQHQLGKRVWLLQRAAQRPLDGDRSRIHHTVRRPGHRTTRSCVVRGGRNTWRAAMTAQPRRFFVAGPRKGRFYCHWRCRCGRPFCGAAGDLGAGDGDCHRQFLGKGRASAGGWRAHVNQLRSEDVAARVSTSLVGIGVASHRRGRFRRQPGRDAALPAVNGSIMIYASNGDREPKLPVPI